MGNPHPNELRERVVKAYESGEGAYPVIASMFSLGEATVKRWVWRHRERGSVAPVAKGGGTPSTVMANDIEEILERLGDATANELTAEFNRARRGRHRIHVSSMKRALHRHGYVVKKNAAGRWKVCARTSRSSVASS
jgi:transposase